MTVQELVTKLEKWEPDCVVELCGGNDGEGYIEIYPSNSTSISRGRGDNKLDTIWEEE